MAEKDEVIFEQGKALEEKDKLINERNKVIEEKKILARLEAQLKELGGEC